MRHFVIVLLISLLVSSASWATVFTVTTNADSGAGSLRDACNSVNSGSGGDSIAFNITGAGQHTITLLSQLPEITQNVTIDATTQSGSSCSNIKGGIAQTLNIILELNGFGAWVFGATASLKGFHLHHATGAAIVTDAGGNVTATCNHIEGNGAGFGNVDSTNGSMTIGGAGATDGNEILSSSVDGIDIINSTGTWVVEGNLIGIDTTNTAESNEDGVYVSGSGATVTVTNNIISGCRHYGLDVDHNATVTSSGNRYGTTLDGTGSVPNLNGIKIQRGATLSATSELISGNTNPGVRIEATAGAGNAITNSIIGFAVDGTTPLCNGSPQVDDLGSGTNLTGSTIDTACDVPPTPLPGCCAILNVDAARCLDQNNIAISSVADCEAVLPSPGPGTPTPAAIYNPALYCNPTPGDVTGACFTPVAPTPTITMTSVATDTPSPTPTPTATSSGSNPTITPDKGSVMSHYGWLELDRMIGMCDLPDVKTPGVGIRSRVSMCFVEHSGIIDLYFRGPNGVIRKIDAPTPTP